MAMASATRSSKRAADSHHQGQHAKRRRLENGVHHLGTANIAKTRSENILRDSNSSRMKRKLDSSLHDLDAIKPKKARITVELLSHSPPKPQIAPAGIARPRPQFGPVTARSATIATPKPPVPPPNKPHPPAPAPPASKPADVAKHQQNLTNGIKHELKRLQPVYDDYIPLGRKLRSQEATRFKSELSAYFPDYDEVIGNDPKEQHILNLETPIIIVDSTPARPASPGPKHASAAEGSISLAKREPHQRDLYPVRGYGDTLFTDLFDSQRIDFSFLEARYKGKSLEDPLPDSYFVPSHKKAERLERSIRNSEKGRAQHEKDQIIRLLEGLQGPDWLRTMGVSGITESRKKTFEPARQHFIKGCQAILQKFRQWNLEEKRRKLEKERALAEEAEAAEAEAGDEEEPEGEEEPEDEEPEDEEPEEEGEAEALEMEDTEHEEEDDRAEDEEDEDPDEELDADQDEPEGEEEDDGGGVESDGDPPDYSDVDASIARQLRDEIMARSKLISAKKNVSGKNSRKPKGTDSILPPQPPSPELQQREFISFFKKKYQRDAALSRSRRRGRKVVAWGHEVPEPVESEFQLPKEYKDGAVLKAQARRKRRANRGSR